MSLKDALLKAYADIGQSPPVQEDKDHKRVVVARGSKGQSQVVTVSHGKTVDRTTPKGKAKGVAKLMGDDHAALRGVNDTEKKKNAITTRPLSRVQSAVLRPEDSEVQKSVPKVSLPEPKGRVDANAKCLVKISEGHNSQLLDLDLLLGCKDSIEEKGKPDVHEMAMGLDFGTSSVKVVIGDLASDNAYAVPFLKAKGVDSYLLPSRVFESTISGVIGDRGTFNLSQGKQVFRDLKLSLLGDPESVDRQVEVIVFLALVIQRSRAWLFHAHKTIYKRVKCIWQLRIGLPAASALDNKYVPLLEKILRAAWQVAATGTSPERALVLRVRDRVFFSDHQDDEPEVRVIPEIAAQIFGFVVSTSFDKKAANRYLMVDVGAGTVDSSLFKVIPGRGGQWNFEFYTAVVQPYGVSNLHASRVDWWRPRLAGIDGAGPLAQDLSNTKFATDIGVKVPVHNRDYFDGVHLVKDIPDQADLEFFEKLMAQVQGSTMWRAWKNGFLTKDQLTKTPMFLCGGGARSDYYLKLETALVRMPSYAWLSAEPWQLGFPVDLNAEGVDKLDFDRLSVAYGLSKLNVGKITHAVAPPMVPTEGQTPFTDRYIDKDQT